MHAEDPAFEANLVPKTDPLNAPESWLWRRERLGQKALLVRSPHPRQDLPRIALICGRAGPERCRLWVDGGVAHDEHVSVTDVRRVLALLRPDSEIDLTRLALCHELMDCR